VVESSRTAAEGRRKKKEKGGECEPAIRAATEGWFGCEEGKERGKGKHKKPALDRRHYSSHPFLTNSYGRKGRGILPLCKEGKGEKKEKIEGIVELGSAASNRIARG